MCLLGTPTGLPGLCSNKETELKRQRGQQETVINSVGKFTKECRVDLGVQLA